MKTKQPVSIKKQSVTVKDLKTRKNPKGGGAASAAQATAAGAAGKAKPKIECAGANVLMP